jgi:hypothetical protein
VVAILVAAMSLAGCSDTGRQPASGSARPTTTVPEKHFLAVDFDAKYSEIPAYADVSWADELQRSQSSGPDAHTRLFNVDGDFRRTLPPPDCDGCKRLTAWFVGGSAAFGIGQRDDHTVASHLVRLAADEGISLDMLNISRDGSTMIEDVGRFSDLMERREPPDLVIFFNGWNDVLVSVASQFAASNGGPTTPDGFGELLDYINANTDEFVRLRRLAPAGHRPSRHQPGRHCVLPPAGRAVECPPARRVRVDDGRVPR